MTDLRKAAEMALEALMQKGEHHPKVYQAAEALRQALAQPEQEPECIGVIGNWGRVEWNNGVFPQLGDRLYSAPPKREWVEPTDEEIYKILNMKTGDAMEIAKALLAKAKDKNT